MTSLIDRGVAIVSVAGDAHACIIATKIEERGIRCHLFETDILGHADRSASWQCGTALASCKNSRGTAVRLSELQVCWWRRVAPLQRRNPGSDVSELTATADLAFRQLFMGCFMAEFAGTFISSPVATYAAENKVVQLVHASASGLKVPQTLISNNPHAILAFGATLGGEMIAKSLLPLNGMMVEAKKLHMRSLDSEEIAAIPTIFQEFVDGTQHIRALIFGDQVILVQFESNAVDWRWQLPDKMYIVAGEAKLRMQLIDLCNRLNISMGIADLKINAVGDIFFFELNPQGQFLFVESSLNISVADIFADFLLSHSASLT